MKIADLIARAQAYDFEHHMDHPQKEETVWRRVPDSQVARLLVGAKLAILRAEAATTDMEH